MGRRGGGKGGAEEKCPHLGVRESYDDYDGWARPRTITDGGVATEVQPYHGEKDERRKCDLDSGPSITLGQLSGYCEGTRYKTCGLFARHHNPERFPKPRHAGESFNPWGSPSKYDLQRQREEALARQASDPKCTGD